MEPAECAPPELLGPPETVATARRLSAAMTSLLRGAIAPSPRLDVFEKRTEWPLAIAAIVFLTAYSVEGLAHPRFDAVADGAMNVTWAVFVLDYFTRRPWPTTAHVGSSVT